MSTRCLPAKTPGAQGLAGFPRGSPSTLPSTHFFTPILEAPAIAAKFFEISENVWGYDTPLHEVLYSNISAKYHEYPHEFESKLTYAADRYGKYIPYILQNKDLFRRCLASAYSKYGWDIPIYIEIGGRNKLDDQLEPDQLFDCSVPEYENIDILKERGLFNARCTSW